MFTKIKQFFMGKPVPAVLAPYKIEIAPATAPIVAEPVTTKPVAKKAAPAAKKPAAKPAARKPAAKKPV
jgi:hypothetical protein